jgi:predicted nucleic acid-binding protein
MIAYLTGEDGADVVEGHLTGDEDCMAHVVNLCEVYYDFLRAKGEDRARSAIEDLESKGLLVREDIDRAFWQEVGRLKAAPVRISLADCFAIALSKRIAGRVATTDYHEFEPIAQQGICEVEFIRPKR